MGQKGRAGRYMPEVTQSDWWLSAVFGENPPIHDDTAPQPGYYKMRLVPRGPFFPARIWTVEERDETGDLMQDVEYYCEVNHTPSDAFEQWLYLCKYPITKEEYEGMT